MLHYCKAHRALPVLIQLAVLILPANEVHGEWERVPIDLRAEPGIVIRPAPEGLLVVQARRLSVVSHDGTQIQHSFTLRDQQDGLVDIAVGNGVWWLASRRRIWSSDDGGHTWRPITTISVREGNEWLALHARDDFLVAASLQGLKRVEAGTVTAWGNLGNAPLRRALAHDGRLVLQTPRGVFIVEGAAQARRLGLDEAGELTALAASEIEMLLANSRNVYYCAPDCDTSDPLPNIHALALSTEGYWASNTGAVWNRQPDADTWRLRTEGLGGATPQALAARGEAVWLLSDQGLFTWVGDRDQSAAGTPDAPERDNELLAMLVHAGPSMGRVRGMVLHEMALVPDPVAGWQRRARWRSAAPTLSLSFRQGGYDQAQLNVRNNIGISATQDRVVYAPDTSSSGLTSRSSADYGVTLRWDLDELVFSRNELAVNLEGKRVFEFRQSVLLDVTRLYYDRLRVMEELRRETDALRQAELLLRLAELTAHLDAYTGGRFSLSLGEEP